MLCYVITPRESPNNRSSWIFNLGHPEPFPSGNPESFVKQREMYKYCSVLSSLIIGRARFVVSYSNLRITICKLYYEKQFIHLIMIYFSFQTCRQVCAYLMMSFVGWSTLSTMMWLIIAQHLRRTLWKTLCKHHVAVTNKETCNSIEICNKSFTLISSLTSASAATECCSEWSHRENRLFPASELHCVTHKSSYFSSLHPYISTFIVWKCELHFCVKACMQVYCYPFKLLLFYYLQ